MIRMIGWAAVLAPALALGQGVSGAEAESATLPTLPTGTGEAAAPAAEAEKAKPAVPELDVSKMVFGPDAIRKVVTHHTPTIQACYEDTLSGRRKPVEGKLNTSFVITPEGVVKSAKVLKSGTTLRGAKLHDCVVAALNAMTFPKPKDGRNYPVEYPFNLKAVR